MRYDSADYRTIFLHGHTLMDVRAPVEFHKGAFPNAINLPLMNDIERQSVGACYQQYGQQAAIALGHQLVSGQTKESRIENWSAFTRAHPDGYLYCFRGGLRSQIVQQWLFDAGIAFPRVIGGYKAMRSFLIKATESTVSESSFVLIGGLTGTGKTEVLAQLDNALDLERYANHRGSSFGKHATLQPSQVDFENRVAVELLKQQKAGRRHLVIEDEGLIIGRCSVPLSLYQSMQQSPLVWLVDSFERRVERILDDYIIDLCSEFVALYGNEQGVAAFAMHLRQGLARIAKRLGNERYQRLSGIMDAALDEQDRSGSVDFHRRWIEGLLRDYYDPMYAFQRERKSTRIEMSGEHQEVLEYLRQR